MRPDGARFVPELAREQIVEATRQTHAIWAAGRALDDHTAYTFRQLELAGPALLHYAGLVDETGVVASMKRYGLALAGPDGVAVPAVGIGAVFTRRDARGRGLASALVKAVLDEARALGAGAAWLHAEIDPAFYERLGFIALPGPDFRARTSELPARGALAIRPAEPGDLDRVLAWYDASFSTDPPWLRPARSPEVFRFFTFCNAVLTWILSDSGVDVGCLATARDGNGSALRVDEWAAPGVARERVWATLRAFAERSAFSEIVGWLRSDHVGPPFVRTQRADHAVPMVALLGAPSGSAAWTRASIEPERTHFGSFDSF
jgi:GNAT superfamily N-acetyltransferase